MWVKQLSEGAYPTRESLCADIVSILREELKDLVIFADDAGTRAAAEFIVHGTYLKTDPGLPEAKGQTYVLPAGGFFDIRNDQIARVTTFYNLKDWIDQVQQWK